LLIIASLLLGHVSFAQDSLILEGIEGISTFAKDAGGNIYVADKKHSLLKFDKHGKQITNVNIKSYGDISSIDCSNPFEIYVYYQDQNIIVFYDNMLFARGEIRLNNYYFTNVSCISRSFDNNIWLIDMSEYKLIKINKKGDILLETPYLYNILNTTLKSYKIWERDNFVFVADSANGIHKFDHYGTHINTYYIKNATGASLVSNFFFFKVKHELFSYHVLTREMKNLSIALKENTSIYAQNEHVYISKENKIISYPAE
ncbi:MAG: hypothetical protein ACPGYY_08795, partial [Bacteroidia bacterium]